MISVSQMKFLDALIPDSLKFLAKEGWYITHYYGTNLFRRHEMFSQVEVETNTSCNRSCQICPNSTQFRRTPMIMDPQLFELLLDQLAEMGFKGIFSPVGYGEPLLDERLPSLMSTAHQKLPLAQIYVYTNGSLLTTHNIRELVDVGVTGIIVSQYEDNLELDGKVIEILNRLPPKYRGRVRYRVLRDDSPLFNRGGLVKIQNPVRKRFCYKSSADVTIDCNGNVLLCANDYLGETNYGNIGQTHLRDIWADSTFTEVRRGLRRGSFTSAPDPCQYCTGLKHRIDN